MTDKNIPRGQSLIEFSLLLPLLLLLVFGFFDFGRAVFINSSLSNAVREGTRAGLVMKYKDYTEDDLKNIVLSYGFGLTETDNPLTKDDIIVDLIEDSENAFYEKIKVTAIYCFVPVTPGMNLIITSTCSNGSKGIVLRAESIMWLEPGTN